MSFKKPFFLSLIFLAIACVALGWKLSLINDLDRLEYKKLVHGIDSKEEALTFYIAKQKRESCLKEFFTQENCRRLIASIKSRSAEMVYYEKDREDELIEKMDGVVCLMVEETSFDQKSRPIVKRIEAQKAQYDYKRDCFTTEDVKLERFYLPGKMVGSLSGGQLFFSGNAKNASFSLKKNDFFQAEDFKAVIY